MYLSEKIEKNLNDNRQKLSGYVSYRALSRRLNSIFKDTDQHLKFKCVKYEDLDVDQYMVGGLYDQTTNMKYIIFNVSSYSDELLIEDWMWSDFVFNVSQTIQHETIHQNQFQHRPYIDDGIKIDFRVLKGTIDEDREYLSDLDEIDAYAHDIAMEIKYFYPHMDPLKVLSTISYKRKLGSYTYYKRTFKGCDWSQIKKRLLSKTYKWIKNV